MGIKDLISGLLPEWNDYLSEIMRLGAEFFAAGVLIAFIAWAIGYAIFVLYRWLNSWSRA